MITEWLDPLLKYFAKLQDRSVEEYSAVTGGEGIGVALEWVSDQFGTPLMSATVDFVAGVLAGVYATWQPNVPTRTRRELASMSLHLGSRVTEILHYPESLVVQQNIADLTNALKRGNPAGVAAALLRPAAQLGSTGTRTASTPTEGRAQPYTPPPIPEIKSETVGPAFGDRAVPYGVSVTQEPYGSATAGRYMASAQNPRPSSGIGRYT